MSSSAQRCAAGPLLVLLLAIGTLSVNGYAQQPEPEAGPPEETEQSSQEVDVSEETYRRYMELKDPSLGRQSLPPLPTTPTAGLEKMDALPEASRRHLRDELREIILGGGPWTPDSAMQRYPFTPSEAARKDGELRQKESEAWGELVGKYHEREAEQYAKRQRAGGPSGNATAGSGSAGGSQGSQGGSQGQGGGDPTGSSASEAARQAQRAAEQSSPQSPPVNRPQPPQGATESALDYLTGGAGGRRDSGQTAGTVAEARPRTAASPQPSTDPQPEPPRASPTPPAEGTEESALDYLTDSGDSAGDASASSTADRGTPAAAGLLTLKELETVRGIGGARERDDPETEGEEGGG